MFDTTCALLYLLQRTLARRSSGCVYDRFMMGRKPEMEMKKNVKPLQQATCVCVSRYLLGGNHEPSQVVSQNEEEVVDGH